MNQKKRKTIITAISVTAAAIITTAVLCFTTPCKVGTPSKANGTEVTTVTTAITTDTVTTGTTTTSTTSTSTSTTSITSTSTLPSTTTSVTETTSVETEAKTEPVTEAPVVEEAAPVTTAEVTEAAKETAEPIREYVVFKPSTHYIHRSTCHWVNSECYEIENTEGLECRKCSECNPGMEIITQYNEPAPVVAVSSTGISDGDYTLLCKIVASEYGGMASVYERAKIVASVMNMVNDSRWPNNVEGVLDQTCAPWGFNKYNDYFCGGSVHYSTMSDAVDYYFNHPQEFANWTCNQWWGDGVYNHFRTV